MAGGKTPTRQKRQEGQRQRQRERRRWARKERRNGEGRACPGEADIVTGESPLPSPQRGTLAARRRNKKKKERATGRNTRFRGPAKPVFLFVRYTGRQINVLHMKPRCRLRRSRKAILYLFSICTFAEQFTRQRDRWYLVHFLAHFLF